MTILELFAHPEHLRHVTDDGSKPRNLTRHPGYDGDPVWSPDGRSIAFVTNRHGAYGIYVMNPDGSGPRKLTNRSE